MAERRVALGGGTLVLVGDDGLLDAAEALARRTSAEERPAAGPVELAGRRGWFKGGHLRGRSRLRHGARRALLASPPPRLRERRNLLWLRERLFRAPRPLAAGAAFRGGLPGFQFLVTEELAGAVTLRAFLERTTDAAERDLVLDELARETARMHALHFVHRDLYPRNLLVEPPGGLSRVAFLDAWAGGPGPGLRGPAYDLGCLMLRGCELLDEAEQRRLFERYVAERSAQGRPVDGRRFAARVARERARLVRRLARRPAEQRGLGPPVRTWSPPLA